jgi:hypothetical protein
MLPDHERFTTGFSVEDKCWVFAPRPVNKGTRLMAEIIIVANVKPKVKYALGFWVSVNHGYLDANGTRLPVNMHVGGKLSRDSLQTRRQDNRV